MKNNFGKNKLKKKKITNSGKIILEKKKKQKINFILKK
jgi:hypothetical protein